jgi:threonine synthase
VSFVKHLECTRCAATFAPGELHTLCSRCQSPLLVRYHLREIKRHIKKTSLGDRPRDIWRYMEVMPVDNEEDIVTLGEGFTPLLHLQRLGRELRLRKLYLKDESLNPTGTFKARGLSAAVSMARKLKARKLSIPSTGNAADALAVYGAQAGVEVHVFLPIDTLEVHLTQCRLAGARVETVPGTIRDAARILNERKSELGLFDVSTFKEPYRVEGKKTMGYEILEQFNWRVPDVIICPAGGGTGLIGMWKAFDEAEELGWIDGKRPRMVIVQAAGCAPLVKAFEEGKEESEPVAAPQTFASGMRVPKALADFLILRAVRASRGEAVAVTDLEMYEAIRELCSTEGIFVCPEGAACYAALRKLREKGRIQPEESIVLLNTGSGAKYVDAIRAFERGIESRIPASFFQTDL